MYNIINVIFIILMCNYQPLNGNTIPVKSHMSSIIRHLNTNRPPRQLQHRTNANDNFVMIPVTRTINAQKLNNFGPGGKSTMMATKNNLSFAAAAGLLNTNELIRNLLNSIDFEKVFEKLDTVSLGKVLRHLFQQLFPDGLPNKLKEALCEQDSSTKKFTKIVHTTKVPNKPLSRSSTSTTEAITYPTAPVTPDPLYYRTTEKSKQYFSQVGADEKKLDNEKIENYDDDLLLTENLSELKEVPVTDDYIEDQPASATKSIRAELVDDAKQKIKREIDDDSSDGMSLAAWLYSLFTWQ